jgi:hypothetical protein
MPVALLPLILRAHSTIHTHLLLQVQHQDHLVLLAQVAQVVTVRLVVLAVPVLLVPRVTRAVLSV